jgi:hypothetical protein
MAISCNAAKVNMMAETRRERVGPFEKTVIMLIAKTKAATLLDMVW